MILLVVRMRIFALNISFCFAIRLSFICLHISRNVDDDDDEEDDHPRRPVTKVAMPVGLPGGFLAEMKGRKGFQR